MAKSKYGFEKMNIGDVKHFKDVYQNIYMAVRIFKNKNEGFNFSMCKNGTGYDVKRIAVETKVVDTTVTVEEVVKEVDQMGVAQIVEDKMVDWEKDQYAKIDLATDEFSISETTPIEYKSTTEDSFIGNKTPYCYNAAEFGDAPCTVQCNDCKVKDEVYAKQ